MSTGFVSAGEAYSRMLNKHRIRNPKLADSLDELCQDIREKEEYCDQLFGRGYERQNNPVCRQFVDSEIRPLYNAKYRILDQLRCEHKRTVDTTGIRLTKEGLDEYGSEFCTACGLDLGKYPVHVFHAHIITDIETTERL